MSQHEARRAPDRADRRGRPRAEQADGLLPPAARDPAGRLALCLVAGSDRRPDRRLAGRARQPACPGVAAFVPRALPAASTHFYAYVLLLADPWPPFAGDEGAYPVDLRVDPPQAQSRLTVLFRVVLAIPALLLAYIFRVVNEFVAFVAWFYCLWFGRMHEGMRDLSAWMMRYELQTYAYVFLLTGRYPSLAGGPGA